MNTDSTVHTSTSFSQKKKKKQFAQKKDTGKKYKYWGRIVGQQKLISYNKKKLDYDKTAIINR